MTKHAIVIGIGPSKIAEHELKSAATDAERMSKFILGEDRRVELLERDPWNVYTIAVHHKRDAQGSGKFLRAAFARWWTSMKDEPEQELHLLIYFAGHATPLTSGDVELLGIDEGWMALGELASLMVESPARNITIVLDCCHSGALEDKLKTLLAEPGTGQKGRAVLAACALDEGSYSYGEKGGLFTTAILNGLGVDKRVVREKITAVALYEYVMANWDEVHPQVALRQGPVGMVTLPRGPDIPIVELVHRPAMPPPSRDRDHDEVVGTRTVVSPRGEIQAERTVDGVRIAWMVRPTGAQQPWPIVALEPSARLLAVTASFDRSVALVAISDRDETEILRIRPDGTATRFAVASAGKSTDAAFGAGRDLGTVLLTSATGASMRIDLASETVVKSPRSAS